MEENFFLDSPYGKIRFKAYKKQAPKTVDAFFKILPVKVKFLQARFSGEELWSKSLNIKIAPENCAVSIRLGEIGYVAPDPKNEASKHLILIYENAKVSESINRFGIVFSKNQKSLKKLGDSIWMHGIKTLTFKKLEE